MAILTGEEARKWKAANPNRAYNQVSKTGEVTKRIGQDVPQMSTLGKMIPFLRSIQAVGDMSGESNAVDKSKYRSKYLDQDTYQQYKDNPFLKFGQDVAGAASMVLPFGGIKGAIAAGALAGGSEGNSAEEILGNAFKGGALGGGLGIAAKGVGTIAGKAGQALEKGGVKIENRPVTKALKANPKSPRGLDEVDALGERVIGSMRDRTGATGAKSLAPTYNSLSDELGGVLSRSEAKVGTSDIYSKFLEKTIGNVDITKGLGKQNAELFATRLNKLGSEATPTQLAQFKRELQGELAGAYKKQGMGNPLSAKEKATMALHDAVDDALKAVVPEAAPLYSQMSDLYSAAPDLIKSAQKGSSVPIPMTLGGPALPLPLGNGVDAASGIVGRGMQSAGQTLQGAGQNKYMQAISRITQNPTLQGQIGGRMLANDGMEQPQMSIEQNRMSNPFMDKLGLTQAPAQDMQRVQAAQQLLSMTDAKGKPLYSPNDVEKYLELTMGPSKGAGNAKRTEGEKKFSAAGQLAGEALQLLESGKAQTGKVTAVKNKFTRFFDQQSNSQTSYLSKLAAARGSAISALSGANVPPSEYARIAAMIPEDNDGPQEAAQKIRDFIHEMKSYSSQ